MAAAAPPTSGATMNSHTWLSACPPTMRAGPSRAHRRVRSSITGRTQPRSWRVGGGHLQLDPETCLSKHRRRAGPRLRGRPTTGHGMRLPSLRREQQSGIDRDALRDPARHGRHVRLPRIVGESRARRASRRPTTAGHPRDAACDRRRLVPRSRRQLRLGGRAQIRCLESEDFKEASRAMAEGRTSEWVGR